MPPPDPYARWVARRGHMRASDADRELVIDALKTAFVQGRLSRSDLASRAGQALQSRTYADLATTTAGLPAAHTAPGPARGPAPARPVNRRLIGWAVATVIVAPGLGVAFFATYYGSFFILLLAGLIAATVIGPSEPSAPGRHGVF